MLAQVNELFKIFCNNRFRQASDDRVQSIAEYLILGRTE